MARFTRKAKVHDLILAGVPTEVIPAYCALVGYCWLFGENAPPGADQRAHQDAADKREQAAFLGGFMPLNGSDDVLHILTALIALGVYFASRGQDTATARRARSAR